MKGRDIVIGLIILVVIAGLFFLFRRPSQETPLPQTSEEQFEESFKIEIPDDVEKADLSDVTGGSASGIATRSFKDGKFTHTVLADLLDPSEGIFYEGWLVRGEPGDSDFDFISTGNLRVAKGGFLLEFESAIDYSDYPKVVITAETVADDTPEDHLIEGTF